MKQLRGIRQILNYDPNWPRNGHLGDLLDDSKWQEGFKLLLGFNFSFDMQINPPQYQKAAKLIAGQPETTVILNHLGTPTLQDLTEKAEQYWTGMEAFSKLPNVFIKISYLCYGDKEWSEKEVIVSAVHRVISLFGASRCMFASNYPVDVHDGWTADRLFREFLNIASRYTEDERLDLFAGTAKRAYRFRPPPV